MEPWFVVALLIMALVATLLALVRQIRLQRALRRLLSRLLHLWKARRLVSLVLFTLLAAGCDDKERQLRIWQQEQVAQVQQHAQQNADTTRALVSSQAESRREFLSLERDLARSRDTLEADRQAVAAARQRLPLLATALQGIGAILLGILALGVCGYLLVSARQTDPSGELEETLLLELAGESALFEESPTALSSLTTTPELITTESSSVTDSSLTIPAGSPPCPTS